MKKIFLAICVLFVCTNIFGQDNTPYHFIAIYDLTTNSSVCGDRTMVNEGVQNKEEFDKAEKQFRMDKTKKTVRIKQLKPKGPAIIYQYNKNFTSMNCTPLVINILEGATVEVLEKKLIQMQAEKPKEYGTPAKIIFRWYGKK